MKIDIQSLGTFNRVAHRGAQQAAGNLTGLTGIESVVDVTKVTLTPTEDIARTDETRVGVTIDFDGGLAGKTALVFDPESAEAVLDVLVPNASGEEMDRSAIQEVGNIMTSGFIDGWADHVGATIDISPPTYVEGTLAETLSAEASFVGKSDHAFVLSSEVTAVDTEMDFAFYMFPDGDSMESLLSGADDEDGFSMNRLTAFNRMARVGATEVTESLTTMTGIDTTVDISRLNFVPVEEIPNELTDDPHVGVVFEFTGLPSGYVMILFDEASAHSVVDALVPGGGGETFGEMERSAIREIGNVMTSSFIDGWANALDTTLDISPPELLHDMGRAIVDPVAARLAESQEFSFCFDATIRASLDESADDREFDCSIYALPDEAELQTALSTIDPAETGKRTTKRGKL